MACLVAVEELEEELELAFPVRHTLLAEVAAEEEVEAMVAV